MSKFKIPHNLLLLMVVMGVMISACERDDICAESTPTTPRLRIGFFDVNDQEQNKVVNLTIREKGGDTANKLVFNRVNEIFLPLRTDTTATVFLFTKNEGITAVATEDPDNTDIVTFNYTTNELYIDRACGFKVTYENISPAFAPGTDGRWIDALNVPNATLVDEDTIQATILH